jgi:putative GTP pyrophosphokinase
MSKESEKAVPAECKSPEGLRPFLEKYRIAEDDFNALNIEWDGLNAIAKDHASRREQLEPTAVSIIDRIRNVPEVHSLSWRLKDPEHLMEKIVRKLLDKSSEGHVTTENYRSCITDLIGIRVLIVDSFREFMQIGTPNPIPLCRQDS